MLETIAAKNLGCFANLQSPALARHSLIYGDNGTGKSTLAAALGSLSRNDAAAITERTSLAKTEVHTSLELQFDGGKATFADGQWSGEPPRPIAIFDQAFVSQNVHAGDELDNDHKKNLYAVILGDTCSEKLAQQAELAETSLLHNRRVKDIERELEAGIVGGLSLDTFLKLAPDSDVAQKIDQQQQVIERFKQSEALNNAPLLEPIELPQLPASFAQTLQRTIDTLSADAEAKVTQHLQGCTQSASTRWIEQGLKVQQAPHCPFCGQSTDGSELLAAYQDFFSDAYNGLKAEIASLPGLAGGYVGEPVLLRLQKLFSGNENALQFWSQHIEAPPLDHSVFDELSDEIGELRDEIHEAIEQKTQNPLESVSLRRTSLSSSLDERIENYNTLVEVANQRIEAIRESQKRGDLHLETDKLNRLQSTQVRHSSEMQAVVDEWKEADATKSKIAARRKTLQAEIEKETSALFKQHGKQINELLERLQARFRLSTLTTSNRTKPPSVQICISIADQKIQLGDKLSKTQRPFRATLSGAERTMLAFALFVAKLLSEGQLSETIVVLDDPISNFDQTRLDCAAKVIHESLAAANQLIVFSHNSSFLQTIGEALPEAQRLALVKAPSGSQFEVPA